MMGDPVLQQHYETWGKHRPLTPPYDDCGVCGQKFPCPTRTKAKEALEAQGIDPAVVYRSEW